MKRVFITEYVGLSPRLKALAIETPSPRSRIHQGLPENTPRPEPPFQKALFSDGATREAAAPSLAWNS
jgi:hypothetical protein